MRQSSMRTWASSRLSKCQPLRSSSRSRPLKLSIQAFCHGEPGSMKTVSTPLKRHQSATAASDELWAVVEPQERGRAAFGRESVEGRDDLVRVAVPADDDRRAFAGELVDDVQQLQRAAIDGRVEQEVQRPQRVRCDRTHRADRGADPTVWLLPFPIRHFQSFLTPQALHPLVVDLPAGTTERSGSAAPTPPRPFPRERTQPRTQLDLVVVGNWRVESLGRAMLTDHLACSALGDPEPFAQHAHRVAPTVRG